MSTSMYVVGPHFSFGITFPISSVATHWSVNDV